MVFDLSFRGKYEEESFELCKYFNSYVAHRLW